MRDLQNYQAKYHKDRAQNDPNYLIRRRTITVAWYARNKSDPAFIEKQSAKNKKSHEKFKADRLRESLEWYHKHKNDTGYKEHIRVYKAAWYLNKRDDPNFVKQTRLTI